MTPKIPPPQGCCYGTVEQYAQFLAGSMTVEYVATMGKWLRERLGDQFADQVKERLMQLRKQGKCVWAKKS